MHLPNWSKNLMLRRRRRLERAAREELFAPVRLSLRRLEERRVLDVSAAFMTMTNVLELDITNTSDVATLQDVGGNVSIRDAGNNHVDIDVDMGGTATVAWSAVEKVVVRGDGAGSQALHFENSMISFKSVHSDLPIEFEQDLVLEEDVLLVGSDLTFVGTIDSQLNEAYSLTIDVGTGSVSFNGNLGGNVPLSGLNILQADGGVTFGDSSPVQLINSTGAISIGSVSSIGGTGVVFNAGTNATLQVVTTNSDVMINGATELQSSVSITTGNDAGDIFFTSASPIDSEAGEANDFSIALGSGNAEFGAAIGSTNPLGELRIASATDVTIRGSLQAARIVQQAGSGTTIFDGPVTINTSAGVDLTTGSVTINQRLDTSAASGPVVIAASDDIAVHAAVTTGRATVELSANDDVLFSSSGSITTIDASVAIRADADAERSGNGGAVRLTDGAFVETGSGVIDIGADEDIQLGRLATTTLVRLTSTSGSIVDGGDTGGADIVADQLALRSARGVGTANPIDTAVNTIAAHNQQSGGVRIENATGRPLTIGEVDRLSGIMNGPRGAPQELDGEVEVIHVGAIDVKAPILNDGGSHTIVRAELSGDLTINAPIQNRGGNGWIFLFSGGDLVINDSLPEPQAEISVANEGAIRGEAIGDVLIDSSDSAYVIVRTHSERFPITGTLPTLSPKFADPARYPPATDTAFYTELEAELQAIRNSISGQATNFAPIFDIEPVDQGGSDIDSNGRGIVKLTIGDGLHLETNWHFTIDWGDGTIESYTVPGNPQASLTFLSADNVNTNQFPDLSNTPRIDSGVAGEPGVYYVHHKYLGPPNPADPSAPIPIFATLRYDAREEGTQGLDLGRPGDGSSIFNGIRFFRNGTEPIQSVDNDVLTNPGEGSFFFIKVIESVIIPVESRQVATAYVVTNATTTTVTTGATIEFVAASFEAEALEEYRLFMQVVDDVAARAAPPQPSAGSVPDEEATQEFSLPLELLDDPISIFRERKFPNGHYRIFLEEIRTGRVRLILDVHIYEGRVVPENFRDGAAERQPGSDDSSQLPSDTDPLAVSSSNQEGAPAAMDEDAAAAEPRPAADTSDTATMLPRSDALLPMAVATLPWRYRVRQALQSETRSISRASLRLRRQR